MEERKSNMSKVFYKKMPHYGERDMNNGNIYLDPKKFIGKVNGLDTILHEKAHGTYPKISEKGIIKETKSQMKSYLSII